VESLTESGLRTRANKGNQELTIADLWTILARRRTIVFGTIVLALTFGILASVFSPRLFKASAQLQVQKESVDGLGLSSMMGDPGATSDALDANMTIQTQVKILESDTLALRAIKDLNLESTQDFKPKFSVIGWAVRHLQPAGPSDPDHVSLEDAPGRRTHASRVFSQHLKVEAISGTRLIEISYYDSDPKVAAAVVNKLIEGLSDYGFQTRFNATSEASKWLSGQMTDLRQQSDNLQAKAVELQRDSGIVSLSGATQLDGRAAPGTGMYSSTLDRLQQATTALTQAQSNRILKEAVYQAVQSGDAELISGLVGNGTVTGSSTVATSLSLIQSLRLQQASLQGQLDELSAKFGSGYSKLDDLRANLAAIDEAIKSEVGRVAARAKNDYEVSLTIEDGARKFFDEQKQQADIVSGKAMEYAIARQEADQSRTLYETLLSHLKEAGVLEGMRSSNFTILDPARIPSTPAKPNVQLYLAASLILGLFFGCGGALVMDLRDHRIHDFVDLESKAGHATFSVLPYHRIKNPRLNRSSLIALDQPQSHYVEALRLLRTRLLHPQEGKPPKVVLITSSVAAEGKTTLAANLAIAIALQGKKVLLIDANLRQPALRQILNMTTEIGLSSILSGEAVADVLPGVVAIERLPTMRVLISGPVPVYPSELLGSDRMRSAIESWRGRFDLILLDAPPVLSVTDALILSTLVDYTLLVARFNRTEQQSLERSYRFLQAEARPDQQIGVVMNAVKNMHESYSGQYGPSVAATKEPSGVLVA
jgi:succinoglycan biosynthesis transport protein ExoP